MKVKPLVSKYNVACHRSAPLVVAGNVTSTIKSDSKLEVDFLYKQKPAYPGDAVQQHTVAVGQKNIFSKRQEAKAAPRYHSSNHSAE
jgi:hypothetical protein